MTDTAIFLLSLTGFGLLLLAMPRHQQDWLGSKLARIRSRALRLSGFAALALAFIVAGMGLGWAYGTVSWFGWLTIGAALAAVANINRERFMRALRKATR